MPEHPRPKAYRVYRGGHVRKDDPDAARFSFGSAGTGVKEPRPVTPAGLSRPAAPGRQQPPASPPLPGRQVATVPSRRRFWPGWKKGVPLVLGVIALLFCFWLYLGYRSFSNEVAQANKRLDKRTKAALAPAGNVLTSSQVTLVLGSDSRGAHTTARADSIILFRTDPGKHLISMLSIPRDMRVPIAGHGDTKINAAYAYGGAPLLIRTINTLTGFKVNHIVLVNFTGFKELIDSLGGVTIYNKRAIVSSQPFDGVIWHFKKGTITLDGRKALAYSRIRHTTNPQDTDISRTERQQLVMQALSHQLVSFSSLLHLPSIGRDIARPLTTDLSANELLGLGWEKFRASRTLECHLGGTPQVIGGQDVIVGAPQNRLVVEMFLGQIAPQPPPKGSLYDPGCTIK
ncbi:MAG: polyisoprenyl-teichoic acid--peptidoglycan teichoic acid transferase [Gaiellales bacterium]|nr:polyisoprenyl-teichoic acid--peptidoglycan teichoic acid transferase [Gaiellales bacterium]